MPILILIYLFMVGRNFNLNINILVMLYCFIFIKTVRLLTLLSFCLKNSIISSIGWQFIYSGTLDLCTSLSQIFLLRVRLCFLYTQLLKKIFKIFKSIPSNIKMNLKANCVTANLTSYLINNYSQSTTILI